MNAEEFISELNGGKFRYTRTDLATERETENSTVRPTEPVGGSSIKVGTCINCYDDKNCLFTWDFGILVAVVKTGAGHLFCDRFEFVRPEEGVGEKP